LASNAYSYAASKAAVHHLTRILAKELAREAITVNALVLGPFPSRMTSFATADAKRLAAAQTNIPLGRLGQPSDLAGAILFLCGRGGSFTTGSLLPVDGGLNVQTGPELFEEG
jgi:NAD(P)-dependent dehydrogenase (short-subunit alcohol dehydrogenase family)